MIYLSSFRGVSLPLLLRSLDSPYRRGHTVALLLMDSGRIPPPFKAVVAFSVYLIRLHMQALMPSITVLRQYRDYVVNAPRHDMEPVRPHNVTLELNLRRR